LAGIFQLRLKKQAKEIRRWSQGGFQKAGSQIDLILICHKIVVTAQNKKFTASFKGSINTCRRLMLATIMLTAVQ